MHHDKKHFWGTLLGALSAALLAAGVYISVFAVVIYLLCLLD